MKKLPLYEIRIKQSNFIKTEMKLSQNKIKIRKIQNVKLKKQQKKQILLKMSFNYQFRVNPRYLNHKQKHLYFVYEPLYRYIIKSFLMNGILNGSQMRSLTIETLFQINI